MNPERLARIRELLKYDTFYGGSKRPVAVVSNNDGRFLLEEIDRLRKIETVLLNLIEFHTILPIGDLEYDSGTINIKGKDGAGC